MSIETMRFKNPTEHTLNGESLNLGEILPGAELDIPLRLCAPTRGDGGNRKPSPLETCIPQLIPADASMHKVWMKVPAAPALVSRIVSVNNNKPPGEPAGVQALRESLAAKKASEAVATPQAKNKAGA
jgi:hypothetical protein